LEVAIVPDGDIWLITLNTNDFNCGVPQFADETWTSYTTTDGLIYGYINSIAIA